MKKGIDQPGRDSGSTLKIKIKNGKESDKMNGYPTFKRIQEQE